jgi:hypothetical protein
MELSPAARRLVFGLIVCALAGLGAYLIAPAAHAHGAGNSTRTHGSPAKSATTGASGANAAAPSGEPDIYQWLPFTPAGLSAAASVAVKFGDSYGSYSYTQSATAYVAPLTPIASPQLLSQIEAAYSVPGVATARLNGKQIAVGTATIGSIRAFGPSSITFLVQVSQQVTGTTGGSQQSAVYAVTVTGSGTSWQVTDIELAAAGNS